MGFSTDFFTVDIPDQDHLVFYRLVNVVFRLKEISEWLEWILDPLARDITDFDDATEAEKDQMVDYILAHNWTDLQTHLETVFPGEDTSDLEQWIERFLLGYYYDTLEISNTLAIDIDHELYSYIPSGTKVQYKASRTSKDSTIYTLGDSYELTRWRKQRFNDNPVFYEVWAVFYYDNISTTSPPSWQYQKSSAEANKVAFGGKIQIVSPTAYDENSTYYIHTYDLSWWAAIGERRETFLPVPNHYYDHNVDPTLIFTTDPATRGGIYGKYLSSDWEYHTDHPDTMGNPWAGDAGAKPYDDDYYNWNSTTVNPPGFTDLNHEFLLSVEVEEIFYGEGRDPEVYAPRFSTGSTPGVLTGLHGTGLPISGLINIFRKKRHS